MAGVAGDASRAGGLAGSLMGAALDTAALLGSDGDVGGGNAAAAHVLGRALEEDAGNGNATAFAFELERARVQYSLSAVLTNTALYLGIAAGMLLVLCVITRWPQVGACFVPRWLNKSLPTAWATGWPSPTRAQVVDVLTSTDFAPEAEGGHVGGFRESNREAALRVPPACKSCLCCQLCHASVGNETHYGFLAWMWVPWCISDTELVARAGLDGFLLFRTMRLVLAMTAMLFAVGMFLMLPTYSTLAHPCPAASGSDAASHGENAWVWGDAAECNASFVYGGSDGNNNISCTCGFFDTLSVNVGAGYFEHEVVATVVGLLLAAAEFALVAREFRFWMRVRRAYTETAPPEIYTVLVRYIPPALRSEVRLRKLFEDLYPGEVHTVHVVPDKRSGVPARVWHAEDVQMRITRQFTINEAYRKVEEGMKVRCMRCRAPEKSMAKLQREEKEALADLKHQRDFFIDSCAMHVRRDLRDLRRREQRQQGAGASGAAPAGGGAAAAATGVNARLYQWAHRKKEDRRRQRALQRRGADHAYCHAQLRVRDAGSAQRPVTYARRVAARDGGAAVAASAPTTAATDVVVKVGEAGGGGGDDDDDDGLLSDAEDDADLEDDSLKLYSNHAFVTFNTATAALACVANAKTICGDSSLRGAGSGSPCRGGGRGSGGAGGGGGGIFCRDGPGAMQIVAARQPRDVRWSDLYDHKPKGQTLVDLFVVLMFVVILVVWGFVVTAIGAYTTADQLACQLFRNCTSAQASSPFWTTAFTFISPLILQAVSAVLKLFVGNLVSMRFVPFKSQVDQQLFLLFWIFQATQNFIIYSIAGSLVVNLGAYIDNPIRLLTELGWSVPEGATFYIVFIETEILFTLMFGLFRVDWFAGALVHLLTNGSIALRRMVYSPSLCASYGGPSTPSTFSPSGPLIRVLFIFLLVNSYAVVQPMITVVGLIYAVMSFSLYTHDMLSVSTTRQDSGGLYWRDVYGVLVACIIIPQFMVMCVVVASDVWWLVCIQAAIILGSCGAAVAIYWPYRAQVSTFSPELAAQIDAATEARKRLPNFTAAHRRSLASKAVGDSHGTLGGSAVAGAPGAAGPAGGGDGGSRSSSSSSSTSSTSAADDEDETAHLRSLSQGLIDCEPWTDAEAAAVVGGGGSGGRARGVSDGAHVRSGRHRLRPGTAGTTVIIPPNVWRKSALVPKVDCLGDRSYLSAATAQDMAYANRHLVEELQERRRQQVALAKSGGAGGGGGGGGGEDADDVEVKKTRAQLLASTFVYDYQHPALRSARNLTSRFTVSARQRAREQAAAALIQTVVRKRLAARLRARRGE